MDYQQTDNAKLKILAMWLKDNSKTMDTPEKRQEAKRQLILVEAEIKDRSGLRGLAREWKRFTKR